MADQEMSGSLIPNPDDLSVTFPLTPQAFRDYIVSLLGQPESIEGFLKGSFEINSGHIEHLSNLIEARITEQNVARFIQFTAKLFFNDDTSISFNTIPKFLGYQELKPIICVGFTFTWSYLITFNDKNHPEKQEVLLSSAVPDNYIKNKSRGINFIVPILDLEILEDLPKIDYSIRCTNKRWGIEISTIIRTYLSSLFETRSGSLYNVRSSIINNFKLICYVNIPLSYICVTQISDYFYDVKQNSCNKLILQASRFAGNEVSDGNKLNFLIDVVRNCHSNSSSLPWSSLIFIFLFLWLLFAPSLLYKLVQFPTYCFLAFTPRSQEEKDEFFRKRKDRKTFWIGFFFVGIFTSLVVAVVANYLTSKLHF